MIKKEVLPNGLRVILAPNKATSVFTAMVMFGVGSRYETDQQAGISHVLEHMFFKGTKKRPTPLEVAEFIESIGAEQNAFTGKEYTGYYTKVAPKHLEKAFDFLSDILLNSTFGQAELEREKSVVIEEINMYEDLPMEMIDNHFEEALFGKNPLGRDVIGTKQTVGATTRQDLIGYQKTYYTAPNTVLVLAGNPGQYSDGKILTLINDYFTFGDIVPKDLQPIELNQQKSSKITNKKTEQSHLIIGFSGVPYAHPDKHKLKVLSVILGGSMSSRMFTEIREKRGLAYAVRSSISSYSDAGALETQVGVPHDKVDETIRAVLAEYDKIRQGKVSEAELNRAKEIIYGRLLIGFEDSLEVASHYAIGETIAGETRTPEEIIKIYERISVDDIMDVAQKYISDDRMTLAYIGPNLTEEKLKPIFNI